MRSTFLVPFGAVIIISIFGIAFPETLEIWSKWAYNNVVETFGWFFLLSVVFFLAGMLVLAFSRYGQIKLGHDEEVPDYSYFGWFSMLFSAGLGIGLLFWGAAEPLSHFLQPPGIEPKSAEAAAFAMRYSFFHWGLHGWAVYIIMSLSLAYFVFRRNMPNLVSSCFYPLLGQKIYGPWGQAIDMLAVFATIFGVATSFGLGALQISSGLEFLLGIPDTLFTSTVIIIIVTMAFLASSIVGLDKGIQLLSKINMFLALILFIAVLLLGPTSYLLSVFTSTLGDYFNSFLEMSLQSNPFGGHEWTKSWTLFYWAWWISWSPFVGIFIARISRGRTIKEFILGVLLVPTLIVFLWNSVFGGYALYLEGFQGVTLVQDINQEVTIVLFRVFEFLPFTFFLSLLAMILIFVFFVTSADSATYVLGMLTSGGKLYPSLGKRMAWGITQALVAYSLLVVGGLAALQEAVVTAALPFSFIMFFMLYSFYRGLQQEEKSGDKKYRTGAYASDGSTDVSKHKPFDSPGF